MQRKNMVEAVRSRLSAAPGRGRTAPTEAAVASKRRPRRMIVLALAAILAALPISAAVQTVGAPKAQAAVDERYSWVNSAVAMAAFHFWRNNANWPATGPSNAQFNTGNGYVNGGGTYQDRDSQLRNWIGHQTGNWGPLNFREYDGETRRNPWDNRGQDRYVLNLESGIIFHTGNHYGDFSPLNFGNLPTPWFPQTVYCYEHPTTQPNDRRIVLHNGHSTPVEWTVRGLPGSGMSVDYHRTWEWWHSGDRRYYVDTNANNYTQGLSFNALHSFRIHRDPGAICREFTPFWYGTF